MRKNLNYIIAFFLLLIIASVFFFSNTSGNLSVHNSNFSIENTDKIKEIKIQDLKNESIITKKNDQWKVNNRFLVKEQVIENFLLAIGRLEIQYPVSNVEKEQIALLLKNEGIKVEINKGGFRNLSFFVSKPSMSEKTYMMMTHSEDPYVVKIPGFKSQISMLFNADENFWRNKVIFDYQPQNISTISVEYPKNKEKSFRIKNFNDGSFALLNSENKPESDFNVDKAARYFTYFQKIQFEDVLYDWQKEKIDSVLKSTPFIKITVEDIYGIKNEVKIYQKALDGEKDPFGDNAKFDFNKAYAMLNNNHELLLIQYYIFDPLLKEIDYFR